MPIVSLREVVERLREQPEHERMAWLRQVLVDDAGRTQEQFVELALAMAQGMGIAVPAEPEVNGAEAVEILD
jgi:hypothetical protein